MDEGFRPLQLLLVTQLVALPLHTSITAYERGQISPVDHPRRNICGKQEFHCIHRELRLSGMLALAGPPATTIDSIA
jgi:hypothetical protein